MLSVGAIRFEYSFCTITKGGIEGSGWAFLRHAVHMATALAGCRTSLVSTEWTISHFVNTNGHRDHSSPLVGTPFPDM